MGLSAAELGSMLFHTLTNIIGLFGNGLLIYLVINKTPKSIRTYSILMLNFGITDFCGCLSALFVQQRLIPVGTSLAYISSGPCGYFGWNACYVGYSIMLHCYAHSLWSLLLSFLYRFMVLKSMVLTSTKLLAVLVMLYSISFFQFITFCFAADDPLLMRQILYKHFPTYNLDHHVVSGNANIFEWKALFTILHMTLPVTPVYCTIVYVRHRIINILRGHKMSENTKTMHKQLLNALTYQAVLPGFFMIAVITYGLGQTGIYNHPVLEYTTFLAVGLLPVVSPIGTLYFVRPYNNWIRRNIINKPVSEPTQVVYSATKVSQIHSSTSNYRA